MIPILAEAATAAGNTDTVMDALPHMAGMLMVMVTLAVLWGVCALTAKLVALVTPAPASDPAPAPAPTPKPAPTPMTSAPAPAASSPAAHGIAPEIVAVIAAAVASATGGAHRIVSIKRQSTAWEMAGRQAVLSSHRIR